MTTVKGKLIGPEAPEKVEIRATLVDVTGVRVTGYVESLEGEVVRPVTITADSVTGEWTKDLIANSLIASDQGDTLWQVMEGRTPNGTPVLTYILVPDTGTHWIGDLRVDLSATATGDGTIVFVPGPAGEDGTDGAAGASAYQVAVANGFVGTEAAWLASLVGPPGEDGSGGAVDSVNGQTGDVVLDAGDVGADPAGSAAAAETDAAADATAKVQAHTGSADPHGDRAFTTSQLAALTAGDVGAYTAAAGSALADRVTAVESAFTSVNAILDDLTNRVGGTFGLENRMTAVEAGVDALELVPNLWTSDDVPANTVGVPGDYALDRGGRRLFGPKQDDNTWQAWAHILAPTEPGWTFNGFAALTGDDLYLTHAADGFGSGTCWRNALETADGLDVTFTCEMSGGTGADGITYALADPADTATTFQGGGGGDLGLVGCTSVALALDTGAGSRARIVTTTPSGMTAVATYGGALNLRAAPVLVRVRYADGAMSAWLDGVQIFDQVTVAATSSVRVGWTGANGGANDDHIIRGVEFVSTGGIEL